MRHFMKHYITYILFITFSCMQASMAQKNLPPTLQADSADVRAEVMTQAYIAPKRVMWVSDSLKIKNTGVLTTLRTGQPDMAREPYCAIQTGKDTVSIILDYGRELHGGLKLVLGHCNSGNPAQIRIRFGESAGEVCSDNDGGKNRMGFSSNDHAIRDFVTVIPRYGMLETGNTGFRFVRIDFLSPNRTIQLKEASAILRYRDIPYTGSFRCSDSRLNEIWNTGAYTVHLNMQEYLWDGIKRDRAVWLGDMHPEVSTIMSVFGQNKVVPKTLDYACRLYPLPQWINGISSYSLWYLIIQHDWYMRGGDKDFLEKHRGYITGLIDKIYPLVDEDGTEHLEKDTKSQLRRFLDWPSSPNEKGVEAGYRALIAWAMTDAEKLCKKLKDDARAEKCRTVTERLAKQIRHHNNLKQAAALMSIAGIMAPEKACDEVISVGGAKNFSTFYGYYMLQAMAMAGEYQEAMDIIRRYWGAMLDLGATTFWEDFNLEWTKDAARIDEFAAEGKRDIHRDYGDYCYLSYRHSLCHGWASGPTAWLTQHVLGVGVEEAGCRTLRITPHLGDLKWAEGTFPTPLGTVSIRHEKDVNGNVKSKIKAPKGIRIIK